MLAQLTEGSGSNSWFNILTQVVGKNVTAVGFENSENINCQAFALIMTNVIRKVRKGVEIFYKRILFLVSAKASSTAIFSFQSINWYRSAWCSV